MALYSFKCLECELEFEKLQRMDALNPQCPKCDAETEKLISGPNALELKGEGFYKAGVFR